MAHRFASVEALASELQQNPALVDDVKRDPAASIARLAEPLQKDNWVYRIVVTALGLAIVVPVIGAIWLALRDKAVPELLVAIGSAAVGALAGLLAPSPARGA